MADKIWVQLYYLHLIYTSSNPYKEKASIVNKVQIADQPRDSLHPRDCPSCWNYHYRPTITLFSKYRTNSVSGNPTAPKKTNQRKGIPPNIHILLLIQYNKHLLRIRKPPYYQPQRRVLIRPEDHHRRYAPSSQQMRNQNRGR